VIHLTHFGRDIAPAPVLSRDVRMNSSCAVGQIALYDSRGFDPKKVPISAQNRSRQKTNFSCQPNVITATKPYSENILLSFFRKP
jgi:hypothetical protein